MTDLINPSEIEEDKDISPLQNQIDDLNERLDYLERMVTAIIANLSTDMVKK
jgi:hypothetical protein